MKHYSNAEKINRIRCQVHEKLDYTSYDSTMCQAITNCYSHALGATLMFDKIYRIGAICGKKPITEDYYSIKEMIELLKCDAETLGLGICEYEGEPIKENEYLIKLYAKIYRTDRIFDYHFLRCDDGVWTEKWRYSKLCVMEDIDRSKYNSFPWVTVGLFKITK